MLGALAWAVMGGMSIANSVKKANNDNKSREASKQEKCPIYMNSRGEFIHIKTGKHCTVQYCNGNRGRIYRDAYHPSNILGIEGEVHQYHIDNPYFNGTYPPAI